MTLEGLFDYALSTLRDKSERAALLDLTDVVGAECLVDLLTASAAAPTFISPARSVDTLPAVKEARAPQDRYPVTAPTPERRAVQLSFWADGNRACVAKLSRIDVPDWEQIADNYPAARREPPRRADERRSSSLGDSGRLILWHGDTRAPERRSRFGPSAWEWRGWCGFHYITDPETFFGGGPEVHARPCSSPLDDEEENEKSGVS